MNRVHLDFETRSHVDLKKTGSDIYLADKSTTPICLAFAINDGPVKLIRFGESRGSYFYGDDLLLEELKQEILKGSLFVAHNAAFEIAAWKYLIVPHYNMPDIPISQWRCTMAKAYAYGLPGGLGDACEYLKLPFQKNKDGMALIHLLCKPNKNGTFWAPVEKSAEYEKFYRYCMDDVESERCLDNAIGDLSPFEQIIWEMDREENMAGVRIDLPYVFRIRALLEEHKQRNKDRFAEATNYEVATPGQRDKIKAWVAKESDLVLQDTRKETIREVLEFELPDSVQEVLEIMGQGSKTSNAKYKSMLERHNGGIIKGVLQYHGAHTGRWAGRKPQLHNLTRPGEAFDINAFVDDVMWCEYDTLEFLYGDVAQAASEGLRGAVIADPGEILRVADYAQMEARMLAYLAGEETKLEAFRKYDLGLGPDIYCVVAEGIYGYPVTKKMPERQPGKVGDLAYGYQGGIGAYGTMSKAYNVDLMAIADNILKSATGQELESAEWTYTNYYVNRVENPMPKPAGLAVDVIKQRWRAKHPKTVAFWEALSNAAIAAVTTKEPQVVGRLTFFMHKQFLVIVLPSGRTMKYLYPHVRSDAKGRQSLSYCSARGWRTMYGGKWAENVVQAAQRDLLAVAIYRLKNRGFRVPIHTHDEAITMSPKNFSSLEEVKCIMTEPVDWAPGLPISVTGWEGFRYGKD